MLIRTRTAASRANNPTRGHSAFLASLLPFWPHELADQSVSGRRQRVALLRHALRQERQRGLAGHWAYDLARHSALLACYRTEAAALEERLGIERRRRSAALAGHPRP